MWKNFATKYDSSFNWEYILNCNKDNNNFKTIMEFNSPLTINQLFDCIKKRCIYLNSEIITDSFMDVFFDDFAINLLDVCLMNMQTVQTYFEMQTAVNNLYSGKGLSAPTLKNRLNQILNTSTSNYYWNLLTTSNIHMVSNKKNDNISCRLSMYGGPAIIYTLKLMDEVNFLLNVPPQSYADFYHLLNHLNNLMDNAEADFQKINKYYTHASELALYHLEKAWKLRYIAELMFQFPKMQIGLSYVKASETGSAFEPIEYKQTPSHLLQHLYTPHFEKMLIKNGCISPIYPEYVFIEEKLDASVYPNLLFFYDLLECIENNSEFMQTNLYLTKYHLNLHLNPSLSDTKIYAQLNLSKFFEDFSLIVNALYYCILKQCITQKMNGAELYNAIYEYCSDYAHTALKKYYSTTSPTNVIAKPYDVTNDKYFESYYKNIANCILHNGFSTRYSSTPKECSNYNGFFNYLNKKLYKPDIFNAKHTEKA